MKEEKQYECVCGKTFTNPQSFNGHKSKCKLHQERKCGSLDLFYANQKAVFNKITKTSREKAEKQKQQKLSQWVSEQHTCEKCGKVMTEKFASGRFCSRSCANSRNFSQEAIKKKSAANLIHEIKYCSVCGKKLQYNNSTGMCQQCMIGRFHHSDKTKKILSSVLSKNPNVGGHKYNSGRGKQGWYKGIHCQSTYELVFVIYCLDHSMPIKRYTGYYLYDYKGKIHKYYPDFIVDDVLYEIKGYWTEQVEAKVNSVKDRQIKVLYKQDLDDAFSYIKSVYNKTYKDVDSLYDK